MRQADPSASFFAPQRSVRADAALPRPRRPGTSQGEATFAPRPPADDRPAGPARSPVPGRKADGPPRPEGPAPRAPGETAADAADTPQAESAVEHLDDDAAASLAAAGEAAASEAGVAAAPTDDAAPVADEAATATADPAQSLAPEGAAVAMAVPAADAATATPAAAPAAPALAAPDPAATAAPPLGAIDAARSQASQTQPAAITAAARSPGDAMTSPSDAATLQKSDLGRPAPAGDTPKGGVEGAPAEGAVRPEAAAVTAVKAPEQLPAQPTLLAAIELSVPAAHRGSAAGAEPGAGQGEPQVRHPVVAHVPLGAVAIQIGVQALAGTRRFDIRLDPPEIGRIDVRLDIGDDGAVKAHLTVDKVETLALLQRDARTLERAFEQAGLKPSDGGVDFTLRDQPGGGQRQGDGERDTPTRAARAAAELPEHVEPVRLLSATTGLDLRI